MPEVREWTSADTPAVDALLDTDPDPLWANQGHRLHGEPREGERWRRTWVAEMGGAVVGAVTVGRNWVHPDRYTCALEVAPAQRRRGIGRLLVEHARSVRPEPRPLNAKVRERDAAARGLATALGAVPYQRAPCPQVDPASAEIRAWCAQSAAVAAVLAGVLTAAHDAGLHEVELDGHDTDPHLAPVVVTLPPHKDDPLLVVELL
jgi:GNAT superfamily N-acetyltransferase